MVRFCNMLYQEKSIRSPYLLACMVDIEEDKLERKSGDKSEHLAEATRVSEDKLGFKSGVKLEHGGAPG